MLILKKKGFLFLMVFALAIAAGVSVYYRSDGEKIDRNAAEIDWQGLGEMDYISGSIPDSLKNMDGKLAKIPGFMVPLEDNQKSVTQFLLVPSPQACIHVPPPPPNQMVLVDMEASAKIETAFGPIWVVGKFEIMSKKHMYGESSFHMIGYKVVPYK